MNRALPDTRLVQGHLPCSGPMTSISRDHPFGLWSLCGLLIPLLGAWLRVQGERMGGWRHLPAWDLPGCEGKMAVGQRGRLGVKAPILPPSPSSHSFSSSKNHFKDRNIYHELYYGRLFFMFKNKRWLSGLYLVYGSRLHVNVLIGHLLYLRCRVSPS